MMKLNSFAIRINIENNIFTKQFYVRYIKNEEIHLFNSDRVSVFFL